MKQARSSTDQGPLIGALLRLCHREVVRELDAAFARAGHPLLIPSVTQPLWDHPAGLRLTELAARSGVTKQTMAELVDTMAAARYVERIADPSDGRARIIRLTRRGREVGKFARDTVRQVEARWAERLGATRFEALRQTLRELAQPDDPSAE